MDCALDYKYALHVSDFSWVTSKGDRYTIFWSKEVFHRVSFCLSEPVAYKLAVKKQILHYTKIVILKAQL